MGVWSIHTKKIDMLARIQRGVITINQEKTFTHMCEQVFYKRQCAHGHKKGEVVLSAVTELQCWLWSQCGIKRALPSRRRGGGRFTHFSQLSTLRLVLALSMAQHHHEASQGHDGDVCNSPNLKQPELLPRRMNNTALDSQGTCWGCFQEVETSKSGKGTSGKCYRNLVSTQWWLHSDTSCSHCTVLWICALPA